MAIYPTSLTDRLVASEDLQTCVGAIFEQCGMSSEDAALLARTLVHSDLRGVHSHGVLRVPDYVKKLREDGVDPRGRPVVASERRGALVIDGGNSMGQIGGTFAMRRAIEKAGDFGVAFAAVRGSNHCGAMDWYTLMAANARMIGIAGTNAIPTMSPWGGTEKIVGINPLSVAIPASRHPHFVLDFAFGATAHGKIRIYAQKGSPIPEGWAFDADGLPTTDPVRALTGLIQPIGQHKGVGLGMAIGMLSTLLSGAAYGTRLGDMDHGAKPGVDGHFFAALDIGAFADPAEVRARVDAIIDEVHASARRDGVDRLRVPGEIEAELELEYGRTGIPLTAATIEDIANTARRLGVEAPKSLAVD